ncbi:MAG: hypothetical protein AB8G15_05540 [Saprospiraceae bacterium]
MDLFFRGSNGGGLIRFFAAEQGSLYYSFLIKKLFKNAKNVYELIFLSNFSFLIPHSGATNSEKNFNLSADSGKFE